jgi:hypothetical protein
MRPRHLRDAAPGGGGGAATEEVCVRADDDRDPFDPNSLRLEPTEFTELTAEALPNSCCAGGASSMKGESSSATASFTVADG